MDGAVRISIRKLLVLALAVTCLGAGYLVHDAGGSSPGRLVGKPVHAKKLTLSDLMLAASTATGIHMRYQGLTTGVVDANHVNEIPIDSLQFGVGRGISSPAGGARGASAPNISEITLSRQSDKYSAPLLNLAIRGTVTGATNPAVSLYFTNLSGPGGTPFDYMRIDLQQVLVSGFSLSSGGDTPNESVSLNFAAAMTFTTHIPAGTTQTVTYNLTTKV